MDNIPFWIVGSSGVGVIVVGFFAIFVPLWVQARRERQANKTAKRANRKEDCAPLLVNTLELRNMILEMRSRHDSRLDRLVHIAPIPPDLGRRYRETLKALNAARSKLIIEPDFKSVDQAIREFLQANDENAAVLNKLLRTTLMKKGNPKELDQLQDTMDAKLLAVRSAVSQFVDEPPTKPPSKVKQMLAAPKVWMDNIRPKKRGTP